jgi:pimeloyl-ACP methyl ester carboxylesterase
MALKAAYAGTTRRLPAVLTATLLTMGILGAVTSAASAAVPMTAVFKPSLTYYKCPPKTLPVGVQCARLSVPLDWKTPTDGRTTTIEVRVMRSKEGGGGLTFNPGFGASGIKGFPVFHSKLPDEVLSRFDFVGWDPRGVGGSGLKLEGCSLPTVHPAETGPVDWQQFWQDTYAQYAAANAACVAANPDAAPYLGTWQVIRDLDALRAVLGYTQWNYWGMSYGTRIGNAYARTFPNRLRALVMDGSVMANETIYRAGTSFPASFAVTAEMFPALAAPDAVRKLRVIQTYLDSAVLALPDGTRLTRWEWVDHYRTLLGSQREYPGIILYIDSLYTGIAGKTPADRRKALKVVATISGKMRAFTTNLRMERGPLFAVVNCSDLHDRPTAEQLVSASQTVELNYGVTQPFLMGNSALCSGLDPAGLSPAVPSSSGMVVLEKPPVFVLSRGDNATPWVWGRSLANMFTGSSTISYDGTQHVAYLQTPSDCVNEAVTTYLLTLERPARDLGCAYVPGGGTPRIYLQDVAPVY